MVSSSSSEKGRIAEECDPSHGGVTSHLGDQDHQGLDRNDNWALIVYSAESNPCRCPGVVPVHRCRQVRKLTLTRRPADSSYER